MSINKDKIKDIFNKASDYLVFLEKINKIDLETFLNDLQIHLIAERLYEVLAQIMLDVCTHIISVKQITAPSTNAECMNKLVTLNIIDNDFAKVLTNLIKMRNRIVHQYDDINYEILFSSLKRISTDFITFKNKILTYLDNNP